jgi:mannosylglycoprotein endo-beta-mannosidase
MRDSNENLTRNLTLGEIHKAINALPKGKAPGHDGLPMEFFHECAEEIAPTFLQAFTSMLNTGRISTSINKGLITLIPKIGDRAKLSNWRPITLLGSTYKVLAKVLAGRIETALTHIIRPNQTGFVEGRSIIDNTYMAQEALEWAEESEQDLVLLFFDFEKAFDIIEWGFLFTTMSKLGFSDTWVRWVKSLYFEASSAIRVNGITGPNFQLHRSVRQGCPLAPYLFILATDVLGYMMAIPKYRVEGLALPKGGLIRDQTFADDTTLYLQGSPSNLDKVQDVLKIFCQASGAKINWHKSATIWASKKERTWEWGEGEGFRWIPNGEGTRYLGI